MFGRIGSILRTRDRANISIMFALSVIPVALATGVAVDLGSALIVEARLQEALDAAALATGSMIDDDQDALEAEFNRFFAANYPNELLGGSYSADVTFAEQNSVIRATGQVVLPTRFLRLAGYNEITIDAQTTIRRQTTGVEVVLVMDNTGSMQGSKLQELKDSATDLVNTLFGSETSSDTVRVGLVPFSGIVNIGTAMNAYVEDPSAYDWGSSDWIGCVMARPHPADVQDTYDTVWPVFHWASDSSNEWGESCNWYWNGWRWVWYCGDNIDTTPPISRGPNKYCPQAITPLTGNKALLLERIDDMEALGSTHINVGAVWGWRVISPSEPFTEGAAYNDDEWQKTVVIMTDGENTTYNNVKSAYGFLYEGTLSGETSAWRANSVLDSRLLEVCSAMKALQINVFTVAYDISDPDLEDMMEDCATSDDRYYLAGISDLSAVFGAIGRQLSELRIAE